MVLVSHGRAALSSPERVFSVTFSWLLESPWKMYFPWLLESLESPCTCDVLHIVIFLTWLLESPSECEIAHMVPRARTLVPISESETKITYQVPGFSQHRRCVIARGRRRARLRTPPAFGGAPSGFEIAPLRAWRAPPVGWPRRGRLRRSEGHLRAWEGPRRGGGLRVSLRSLPGRPPGLRCSSRQALRRSRFRCPLGFPFSLSPLLYPHSINRHPPCQAPAVCPSPHF
jgi:hypothetical protein|nr:MAG TPA: hypothetical protein [Caudoviricetes sp.]